MLTTIRNWASAGGAAAAFFAAACASAGVDAADGIAQHVPSQLAAVVPEPGPLVLLVTGAIILLWRRPRNMAG